MTARWDDDAASGVREGWDALADDYDHRHGDDGNDWHRLLIEPGTLALLGDVRGKRVPDPGCGTGVLARSLLASGARVVGADGSAEFLERARRRPGAESIEWAVVDATQHHRVGAGVDRAVCDGTLEVPPIRERPRAVKGDLNVQDEVLGIPAERGGDERALEVDVPAGEAPPAIVENQSPG